MKKEVATNSKKCCMWDHLCKEVGSEIHLCCSFCPIKECEYRCCDNNSTCKYAVEPTFYKEISQEQYKKYNKIYKYENALCRQIDELFKSIDSRLSEIKENKQEKSIKRGRGRPPKIKEEIKSEPIKRGRGRPKKIKE